MQCKWICHRIPLRIMNSQFLDSLDLLDSLFRLSKELLKWQYNFPYPCPYTLALWCFWHFGTLISAIWTSLIYCPSVGKSIFIVNRQKFPIGKVSNWKGSTVAHWYVIWFRIWRSSAQTLIKTKKLLKHFKWCKIFEIRNINHFL